MLSHEDDTNQIRTKKFLFISYLRSPKHSRFTILISKKKDGWLEDFPESLWNFEQRNEKQRFWDFWRRTAEGWGLGIELIVFLTRGIRKDRFPFEPRLIFEELNLLGSDVALKPFLYESDSLKSYRICYGFKSKET